MLNIHPFNYPPELAAFILNRWANLGLPEEALLPTPALALVLALHYHASFLQEEGRPVLVRSLIGQPEDLRPTRQYGDQLHVMRFSTTRPVTEQELRRIAHAANPYRSMLGLAWNGEDGFDLWGMVGTGTRWLSRTDGGRYAGVDLPPRMVIQILGPGRLRISCGYETIAEIVNGKLREGGMDPLRSRWLQGYFRPARQRALELFEARKPFQCAHIREDFVQRIAQNAARRVLSLARNSGHGGMILYVPEGSLNAIEKRGWLRFKYRFDAGDSAGGLPQLIVAVMLRLAELGREAGKTEFGWEDYQTHYDQALGDLDEDLFEFAHWFAEMMGVDGALVLSQYLEVLGFGAEIRVPGEEEEVIHRALDVEADETRPQLVDESGTRHRSAFRFCRAVPGSLAMVVSQDGSTRMLTQLRGKVCFWPYAP